MGDAYSPPQESLTCQSDIYSLHLNGGKGLEEGRLGDDKHFREEGWQKATVPGKEERAGG